jgi:SAM-dependent methyltransferase
MSTGYALAYRLGVTPWERAGEAAQTSFAALLDREEVERSTPLGRALDLGCGRGWHTHELARRGWQAVGVDNVSRAVEAATRTEERTATFAVGDVTNLAAQDLGTFDLFLDVGCFHGLRPQQRLAAARGISSLANPGATLLMLAFRPMHVPVLPRGLTRTELTDALAGWDLVAVEAADTSGMPGLLKKAAPQWYRLRRAALTP